MKVKSNVCTVVNLTRSSYDVYIGRRVPKKARVGIKQRVPDDQNGYFGNPFHIGRDGTREQVIEKFRTWFDNRIVADPAYRRRVLALRGKRLGCFCKPLDCHGDIIAEWVNAQEEG